MNIAPNKADFLESLFTPINGKTYDGYVIKRNKCSVRIFMLGAEFVVNKHAVLCATQKLENGKEWFSFAPFHVKDKIGTFSENDAFCRALLKGE